MFRKIRKSVPNWLVNYLYHLPLAVAANFRYGFPGRKIKVIGITGTDGKTTTTNMVYQILKAAGKKASMISTINAEIAGRKYDTGLHVTNPGPFELQRYLKQAVNVGDEYMVLEVTSHGLDQFRTWGIKFEIGLITNITHEHLDYHKTFKNYVNAKAILIRKAKFAVLNADDPSFDLLKNKTRGKIVSFGIEKKALFNPKNYPLKIKIPGRYNLYNSLGAAAAADILKISSGVIRKSLEGFSGLLGRMEEIKNNRGIKIVVDFAHTPNALQQALLALRKETKGKLIAVFGCAGARDKDKRPMMGRIAGKLADIVILTDEDPRFEDRNKIIEEIAAGVYKLGLMSKNLFKEPDRRKAIEKALRLAGKGDLVGIFGKGHERSMNYRGVEKLWSDQETARQILKNG